MKNPADYPAGYPVDPPDPLAALNFDRTDNFDMGQRERDHPPGAHAEGLVNLMRESHWSAHPGAAHDRGMGALFERTAQAVPHKFGKTDYTKSPPPARKAAYDWTAHSPLKGTVLDTQSWRSGTQFPF